MDGQAALDEFVYPCVFFDVVKNCVSFVKIWCLPTARRLCYAKSMEHEDILRSTGGKNL